MIFRIFSGARAIEKDTALVPAKIAKQHRKLLIIPVLLLSEQNICIKNGHN